MERVPTGFMVGEHVREDEAASHAPARGLQSAGTLDRPTRLEFSMAFDWLGIADLRTALGRLIRRRKHEPAEAR